MFINKERLFFNTTQRGMKMQDVIDNLIEFMAKQPYASYKLVVGTDAQVIGGKTCFATAILLHRTGQGMWACIGKQIEIKHKWALREKINLETQITYDTINEITDKIQDFVIACMINNKGFSFQEEAHIDVGVNGPTRMLIRDMESYFRGTEITPVIKPYSYAASCVANRFSKCI